MTEIVAMRIPQQHLPSMCEAGRVASGVPHLLTEHPPPGSHPHVPPANTVSSESPQPRIFTDVIGSSHGSPKLGQVQEIICPFLSSDRWGDRVQEG